MIILEKLVLLTVRKMPISKPVSCMWLIGVSLAACVVQTAAHAQPAYPSKPVRLVIPYSAGGPTERLARVVGNSLAEMWGQQIVIDMRPGANSIIGTDLVAKATPDGYTMLMALPALAINPSVYKKLPYDASRDLLPITLVASASYLFLVSSGLPAKSVSEVVALAKKTPNQLSFGSGGVASPAHLAMELFKQKTATQIVHVPYKGGAPALTDLVSNQIQILVNPALSSLPMVKAGRLRALAVTSSKRSRLLPDLPTVAEMIKISYDVTTWYGLFAPARTPRSIVDKTSVSIAKVLQERSMQDRLVEFDAEPVGSTPREFERFMNSEIGNWRAVVQSANVEPQ